MVSLAFPLTTPVATPPAQRPMPRPRWIPPRDRRTGATRDRTPSDGAPIGGALATPTPRGPRAASAASDGLSDYLRAVGRVPLLDAEQERALITRMRTSPSPEARQAARRELVERNLRLVVACAKSYSSPTVSAELGLPLEDLIQEGNIGLLRAADRFDLARGVRFTTMAVWYIRQAIGRALVDQGPLIGVPLHMHTKRRQYWRLVDSDPAWRRASDAAVAEELGLSESTVGAVRAPQVAPASLEGPLADQADDPHAEWLGALLPDTETESVEEVGLRRAEFAETLAAMREILQPREFLILTLRYLPGGYPVPKRGPRPPVSGHRATAAGVWGVPKDPTLEPLRTLDEIGALLDPPICHERVRQIETRALRKLRRYLRV